MGDGDGNPGGGVLRMNGSPAQGLEQDISGNNAVVVRKRECSRIAAASSAARISGGCEVCNLESKALPTPERLTSAPRGGNALGTLCGDRPSPDRWESFVITQAFRDPANVPTFGIRLQS